MTTIRVDDALRSWAQNKKDYMQRRNQDLWLPIYGREGRGKSTLGLLLTGLLDPTFFQAPVDRLEREVAQAENPLSPDEYKDLYRRVWTEHFVDRLAWRASNFVSLGRHLTRSQGRLLDEARGTYGRRAMSGENMELYEHIRECRKMGLVNVTCHTDWGGIDPGLASWRPDERIHVYKVGWARMYTAKRDDDDNIVDWGRLFDFEIIDLSTYPFWDVYEQLAEKRSRTGKEPNDLDLDQDVEDPRIAASREWVEPLAPLAQQWANAGGLQ